MTADRLADLSAAGVSIWLDDLDRGRLTSGGLAELVHDSFVVGVTTNPSIFEKAIVGGAAAYADQVHDLAVRGVDVGEAIRAMTAYDVRWACDVLARTHAATGGVDGRVSIEVDPRLAARHRRDHRRGQVPALDGRPAERAHQDPRDGRGPPGHHRGARRGHQRQRHADLLGRPLPRRARRLARRARAREGQRPQPRPRSSRSRRSSSAASTARSTSGSAPARRCSAPPRSPTRGSRTRRSPR